MKTRFTSGRRQATAVFLLGMAALLGCKPSSTPCSEAAGQDCPVAVCAGCMLDGRCEPGTSTEACGVGGGVCSACSAGDVCSRGRCGLDLDQTWRITPAEAQLDVSIEVVLLTYCPSTHTQAQITLPQNSATPRWTGPSCTMTTDELLTHGFDYMVYQGLKKVSSRQRVLPTLSDLEAGTIRVGPVNQLQSLVYKLEKL